MHVYETNTIYICIKCVSIERYKRRGMHELTCTTLYMSGSLERGRDLHLHPKLHRPNTS